MGEIYKTSVYVDRDFYDALRMKLIPAHLSFTSWLDKMLRKELGKSPKFSYPDEPEEQESKTK